MNGVRIWRPLAAALAMAIAGTSVHALTNPPIRTAQGIEYMCGGQTNDEAAFMRTVSPRWAATLEFAINRSRTNQFPTDVKVIVRERYTGRLVMEAASDAPFMVARLDPGAYDVEATMGGVSLQQPLTVFAGMSSSASFVWPSNVDFLAAAGLPFGQSERHASAQTGD